MSKKLRILFLGDIVGRPGRHGVRDFIAEHKNNYDVVIANVENASHGYGLTKKNYGELSEYGIDVMTAGNHIWDRKEIFNYIQDADKLVRPLNYPEKTPGKGSGIFKVKDGISIGVINALGTVFMPAIIPPTELLKQEIQKLKKQTSVIIVDYHAEATAEKISFGHIAKNEGASAFLGTHTHVQTADEQIIDGQLAYISDAGFCGSLNSVIGMEVNSSVERLTGMLPARLEVGPIEQVQVKGVELVIDANTGKAEDIKRISKILDFDNEVKEE